MKARTHQTNSLVLAGIIILAAIFVSGLVFITRDVLGQEMSVSNLVIDQNASISADALSSDVPAMLADAQIAQTINESSTTTGDGTAAKTVDTAPLLNTSYVNTRYEDISATAVETGATKVTVQPAGDLNVYEIPPEENLDVAIKNSSEENGGLSETNPEIDYNIQYIENATPQDGGEMEEITDQNIELSEIFIDEGADISQLDEVSLETVDGETYALVPEEFQDTDTALLELTDEQNEPVADIILSYGDVVQTIDGVEKREIDSMRLITHEEETDIKTLSDQFVTIKVHLDAQLKHINREASLDINTQTNIDPKINEKFSSLAQSQRLGLMDRAGVFTVQKTSLSNGKDIGETSVIFKIEKTWQGSTVPEQVKILRYDEENGQAQILPTIFLGEEGEYAVFRGNSSHGLSTFAVFMVETIQSTEPAEFKMGLAKRFGLPLFLIVLIGGIFVGTFLSKGKGKHKNKHD